MEQLVQELAKVELERNRYEKEVEQKQQRLQEYENQIAQYKAKVLYSGSLISPVDHSYDTRMKELEDCLTEQKCDLVTKDAKIEKLESAVESKNDELVELREQLDNEKAEMEKERNVMKQSQDTKESELKQNMAKLQCDLDQAIAAKSLTERQLKSIRKRYDEEKQQFQRVNEEFERTREQLKLKEESSENIEDVRIKLKDEITELKQTLETNKEYLFISQAKAKHLQQQLDKKAEGHSDLKNDLEIEKKKSERLEKEVVCYANI